MIDIILTDGKVERNKVAVLTKKTSVTKIRYFGTYIRYLPTSPMSLQL